VHLLVNEKTLIKFVVQRTKKRDSSVQVSQLRTRWIVLYCKTQSTDIQILYVDVSFFSSW